MEKLNVGMLLFPDLTLQDFVGPYDVFIKTPCFQVYTIGMNTDEMKAEGGLRIRAEHTFESSPAIDILFVPGGRGITPLLQDATCIAFLQRMGANARYITSVCTGSLLLAAAGLLNGYKATTHWRSLDLLRMFSIETVEERVVIDRNRITGGGITAGIDFGLVLTALIAGEDQAKLVQLLLEYNPQPPFQSGSCKNAEPHVLQQALEVTQTQFDCRKESIEQLVSRMQSHNP